MGTSMTLLGMWQRQQLSHICDLLTCLPTSSICGNLLLLLLLSRSCPLVLATDHIDDEREQNNAPTDLSSHFCSILSTLSGRGLGNGSPAKLSPPSPSPTPSRSNFSFSKQPCTSDSLLLQLLGTQLLQVRLPKPASSSPPSPPPPSSSPSRTRSHGKMRTHS